MRAEILTPSLAPFLFQSRGCQARGCFWSTKERRPDSSYEIFKVFGSTGNVYTVVDTNLRPTCDCPDSQKNGTCKHISFVMLRVLHVPESSQIWYLRGLLPTELAHIFATSFPNPLERHLA